MTSELRGGYSTGTCAAAAAKAAALCLHGEICKEVDISLPDGIVVNIPVESVKRISDISARAAVVKDAGDDPDITDGMIVEAIIECMGDGITFAAGDGVGTVTGPGLQIPPGQPAINPVPRTMIAAAIHEILGEVGCRVTISIPGGEVAATRTFNPRLGIKGGLSILGTSGRVMPKSDDAWLQSLVPQIDVALAAGQQMIYLTPGGLGEQAVSENFDAPRQAIVQTSNFIGEMLCACAERGIESVVLVGHVGKLVKVAAGIFNTHNRFGDARLETVAAIAAAEGAPGPLVAALLDLPTCEAALSLLAEAGLTQVWDVIADRAAFRATRHAGIMVSCALVGYDRQIVGRSAGLRPPKALHGAIYVVGVGPGPNDWLTPAAWKIIRQAEVVVGGKRQLQQFASSAVTQIEIGANIAPVVASLRDHFGEYIVVLASGDPGCFGIMATLRRELPDWSWQVLPGISSMQLALARLGESWENVYFASAHGRDIAALLDTIRIHSRVLTLTDRKNTAQQIAAALCSFGFNGNLVVLERLGYPEECITCGTVDEISAGQFDPLSVLWIERKK